MKAKDLAFIALFSVVIVLCTQIALPIGIVPITLQTFSVALAGCILGKKAPIAVVVYLLLGLVGVPVFSSFRAGFPMLIGATGGFLFGFLPLSVCTGFTKGKRKTVIIVFDVLGLLLCHACGVIQLSVVTGVPVLTAFLTYSLPFWVKDGFSVWFARVLANKLEKSYRFD